MNASGEGDNAEPVEDGIDSRRLEAFSDGVMAVIITIMAFQLKTPVTATLHAFSSRVPALLVYVLSFASIGIYWNNHHHLLRMTRRIDGTVMWANSHLLFWLSLIPFATAWIGAQHSHPLPAATYGVVAFGAALAYYALVKSILRANRDNDALLRAIGRDVKGMASPILYAAGVALAYVNVYLAYACYVAVAVMWFVPDRRLVRRSKSGTRDAASSS